MAKIPDIKEEIKIPDGVEASKNDKGEITIKGEKGSLNRVFSHPKINIKIKDDSITLTCKNPRRKEKALLGTFVAHIKNMIKGVNQGFEYKMKTVFSHFPVKTTVEGNELIVKNFLGEKSPRKIKIPEDIEVKTKGEDITVSGINKERVGQTVADIERLCKIKKWDIRVFQDGIYKVSSGGT